MSSWEHAQTSASVYSVSFYVVLSERDQTQEAGNQAPMGKGATTQAPVCTNWKHSYSGLDHPQDATKPCGCTHGLPHKAQAGSSKTFKLFSKYLYFICHHWGSFYWAFPKIKIVLPLPILLLATKFSDIMNNFCIILLTDIFTNEQHPI